MTLLASNVHTLLDVTRKLAPDGKEAAIAELLTETNDVLADMGWKEGNLPTGERTTIRTSLPSSAFRQINAGTPASKSTTAQVDEGAAELVARSEVDRTLAILSGNPGRYRLNEAGPFFESMNQKMADTLFYGNAKVSPKEFTGLAPRYNSLSGFTGSQIISGGGSGSDNRSIWLVAWGENTVSGIYPKNTKAGLMHMDTTANSGAAPDGHPIGDLIADADGNKYLGYSDWYQWNCGLMVKDYRYAVRIANIDKSLLTANKSTGADIQDLMVQALERIHSLSAPGTKVAFYVPRTISSFLRRQLLNTKNAYLSWDEMGGKKVMSFGEVVVRRTDALEVDEAAVV